MPQELESNNSLGSANTLQSGVSTTGQLSNSSDVDFYKLAVGGSGTVNFSFQLPSSNYRTYLVDLYDTAGTLQRSYSTSSSGNFSISSLSAGNVYVKIDGDYNTSTADYQISASMQPTSSSVELESNNSLASANTLQSGVSTTGQLSNSSDVDFYKIGRAHV